MLFTKCFLLFLMISLVSSFIHHNALCVRGAVQRTLHLSAASSSVPVNRGNVVVSRDVEGESHDFNISYRIFRPMALSSRQAAPIVALHGGPSLPSDYLEPLVDCIPYRSIVLYDQLGCGDSDEPKTKEA